MSLCYVAYMLDVTSLIILSVYLKQNVVFLNLYPYHGNRSRIE